MSQKKSQKKTNDPYLSLVRKIFKNQKIYLGEDCEVWEGEVLRVNFRDGLRTILTGLPEDARKVVELRFGLNGQKPMTQKLIAEKLGITLSRARTLEKNALFELGLEHCRYFYLVYPYAKDDDVTFQKSLDFLRGSGFTALTMYLLTQVGVCDTEELQIIAHVCPELFNIFTDEGCDQLVKMGCEDPREQETLEDYCFDDDTRIEMLNFSPKTHEMLTFGNGVTTIGLLRMLDYEAIISLYGVTEEEIIEICEKIVRLGDEDPRGRTDSYSMELSEKDMTEELMRDYMNGVKDELE